VAWVEREEAAASPHHPLAGHAPAQRAGPGREARALAGWVGAGSRRGARGGGGGGSLDDRPSLGGEGVPLGAEGEVTFAFCLARLRVERLRVLPITCKAPAIGARNTRGEEGEWRHGWRDALVAGWQLGRFGARCGRLVVVVRLTLLPPSNHADEVKHDQDVDDQSGAFQRARLADQLIEFEWNQERRRNDG
jgi:hypothetical protein